MNTRRTLQEILDDARAEMDRWPAEMKQMVAVRRAGLEHVAREERRSDAELVSDDRPSR